MQRSLAAILLCTVLNGAVADESSGESSVAVAVLSESALLGMQLAVRARTQRGEDSAAVADCVRSIEPSSFHGVFESLRASYLSADEQQSLDQFLVSPVGSKYVKHGLLQVYVAVGEEPPEPLPAFSDEEYNKLENFSHTSVGEKLLVQKVFQQGRARRLINSKIRALMASCRGSS